MLTKISCKMEVGAQSTGYPTYANIDCDLQTTTTGISPLTYANIDCDLAVIRTLSDACIAGTQSLRVKIEIDSVDVTSSLVRAVAIQHNKNMISTFSLSLKNTTYSPLNSTNITLNKVVVITSYIDGYEAKLFTGLIDDTNVSYTLNGFQINVSGSGYGKKLRNKRATLVSIQDSADTQYRGALIKYLAEQAGITSVDSPQGSYTRIDHSFEDQSILDMITKELTVDTYWWRFDEDAVLKIALDEIKTNTTIYPTADWTYGEDRFLRLGLVTSDADIINTVRILGTVYETQIEVADIDSGADSPFSDYTIPATTGYTTTQLVNFYNSFASGADPTLWSASDGNFSLAVTDVGTSFGDVIDTYKFRIDWSTDQYEIENVTYSISGVAGIKTSWYDSVRGYAWIVVERFWDGSALGAFTVSIGLIGKYKYTQSAPEEDPPTSAIVDNEEVASPTYEYEYNQVAANVVDSNSVAKYGERKPGTEGTLEFPLAENFDQCKGIGKKIIRDSHRFLKQPDFEVAFNPFLKVGQTITITDKKIGYNERWYVEAVRHNIGQGKGRTTVGCVYYA